MTTTNSILNVVPALQATALLGHNVKLLRPNKTLGNKAPIKNIVKVGVGNLVGVGLIKSTAKIIN